jgi:hypothetical protein
MYDNFKNSDKNIDFFMEIRQYSHELYNRQLYDNTNSIYIDDLVTMFKKS